MGGKWLEFILRGKSGKYLLPLAQLPVKFQESPVEVFDIAAGRAPLAIAELFINRKVGNAAAPRTIAVSIMEGFRHYFSRLKCIHL